MGITKALKTTARSALVGHLSCNGAGKGRNRNESHKRTPGNRRNERPLPRARHIAYSLGLRPPATGRRESLAFDLGTGLGLGLGLRLSCIGDLVALCSLVLGLLNGG